MLVNEKNTVKKEANNKKQSDKKRYYTAHKKAVNSKADEKKSTPRKPAAKKPTAPKKTNRKMPIKEPLKIIPLGGLNEIGKNMTVFEWANDAVIIDCGLSFPDEEMLGVDLVIPDFTYIEKIKDKVKGIFITHGHEDHIGALPYLCDVLSCPIYGTRLTLGLVEGKLREKGNFASAKLVTVKPKDKIKTGAFEMEIIRVNHSIPDAVGFAIKTPAGTIVHTGDFKIDSTPIEGGVIDLARFGALGKEGVLALMADSTNAERPGFTLSERTVGESFEKLFAGADNKRIIIATFSSNIHRIQQIVNLAVKHGRKVAISGRSMSNVVAKAIELGYLSVPDGVIIDIDSLKKYNPSELIIITTGSQGEPMSALSRMSTGDHRQVSVGPGDFIIVSATPIPGNEKFVSRVVNELMRLGADVIYEKMYDVHVSGHACQEELKLILSLVKPKYFIPVHGEYKHLKKNSSLAQSLGLKAQNIIIGENGKVIETDGVNMKFSGNVPSGQVMVDGLGVGDVGSIVLRDRKHLAEDGIIIIVMGMIPGTGNVVSGPEIISRGFVYVKESEELMDGIKKTIQQTIYELEERNVRDWSVIKTKVKDSAGGYVFSRTKRRPMILPIVIEV
ncbi:MAG: RNase J family beta-CASP ribonuclease [Oscillospiraceae bacterium]|nr:RNase J family beta-CASP ribonuclease [Oscillospiraceae bacterium]